ncbi:MAG: GGDEF domain-containing protein [Rubrivivax sp.]|nr:GGDEF domain-containing protein [Rubrivivax sp.]
MKPTAQTLAGPPDIAARLQACLAAADPAHDVLSADAREAAREAESLARQLGRLRDEGRAGTWSCWHLLRLGRYDELRQEAVRILPLLADAEAAADRRELLRLLTLAACETGAFDVALDAAHELAQLAGSTGDAGPALTAASTLAACFERMGDSWQAVRVLSKALQAHGDAAPDLPLVAALNAVCAISIGEFHRLRGAAPEDVVDEALARARAAGEWALGLLERLPDPAAYEVVLLGNLGEVLLHQGERTESDRLLRRANERAAERGFTAYGWRVACTQAEGLRIDGHAAEAWQAMTRLLIEMGDAAPPQTAIRAHHVAYLACRTLGRFESALTHFEAVERLERQRASAQLRAQSQLFVTRTEAQHAQWAAEQARQEARQQRARAVELAEDAERDPLTGLGNRRHLDRRCSALLPAAEQEGQPLSLAVIDIDRFKSINDQHGHAGGDRVLVAMAQLLRENTRTADVLVRHGGEEFVIVLPGMSLSRATEVCERLRHRIAAHAWAGANGASFIVTASVGLVAAPAYDLAVLMERADAALYRAKRGGRNRLCVGRA